MKDLVAYVVSQLNLQFTMAIDSSISAKYDLLVSSLIGKKKVL